MVGSVHLEALCILKTHNKCVLASVPGLCVPVIFSGYIWLYMHSYASVQNQGVGIPELIIAFPWCTMQLVTVPTLKKMSFLNGWLLLLVTVKVSRASAQFFMQCNSISRPGHNLHSNGWKYFWVFEITYFILSGNPQELIMHRIQREAEIVG